MARQNQMTVQRALVVALAAMGVLILALVGAIISVIAGATALAGGLAIFGVGVWVVVVGPAIEAILDDTRDTLSSGGR